MKVYSVIFILIAGCAVNSIAPSGGGIEMEIDTSTDFRHGWTYISKPFDTAVSVHDKDSIDRGRQLFLQHCEKCHGNDGKGVGPLAKALNLKPANLSNLPHDLSKTYLLVQIKEGKGSMPKWRDLLTESQARDLTNYITKLSEK